MENKITSYILKNVRAHPEDIVSQTMRRFQLTRPAVHRHLQALLREGRIHAVGRTRNRQYILARGLSHSFTVILEPDLSESNLWQRKLSPQSKHLSKTVQRTLEYGFTEMVNNVLDHSGGKSLTVRADFSRDPLHVEIADDGVGVFERIRQVLHLSSLEEALLHLTKGKLTTDPSRHSGEGIFFTSRVFDRFLIESGGIGYMRVREDDWALTESAVTRGTRVRLTLSRKATQTLNDVFTIYAPPEDNYQFNRTQVIVELSKLPGETFVSRSQARRILLGLDKFKTVILDFKGIETVGQGFADEIFRVHKSTHPEIEIRDQNANKSVLFMIRHALAHTQP